MDKAHALGLVGALEAAKVPCAAVLAFDAQGVEGWTVTIPTTFALDGGHLAALCNYCAAQGLTLSATFDYLGVS